MPHVVYILFSDSRNLFYVGMTNNLERRLEEHNSGKSGFTKSGMPWRLLWSTIKSSKFDAEILERKLKNYSRQKKVRFKESHQEGKHNQLH
jgi:putative endonuclease